MGDDTVSAYADALRELDQLNSSNAALYRAVLDLKCAWKSLDSRMTSMEEELASVRQDCDNYTRPARVSFRHAQGALKRERDAFETFRYRCEDSLESLTNRLHAIEIETNVLKSRTKHQHTQDELLASIQVWAEQTTERLNKVEDEVSATATNLQQVLDHHDNSSSFFHIPGLPCSDDGLLPSSSDSSGSQCASSSIADSQQGLSLAEQLSWERLHHAPATPNRSLTERSRTSPPCTQRMSSERYLQASVQDSQRSQFACLVACFVFIHYVVHALKALYPTRQEPRGFDPSPRPRAGRALSTYASARFIDLCRIMGDLVSSQPGLIAYGLYAVFVCMRSTTFEPRAIPIITPNPVWEDALTHPHRDTEPQQQRARSAVPPAETGRPETAREFAKQINRVTLCVSGKGREGATPAITAPARKMSAALAERHSECTTDDAPITPVAVLDNLFLEHLEGSSDGIDLVGALRGRFGEDEFFGRIQTSPKEYKNFRVDHGLVFIRDQGTEKLCVPDVRVNGRSAREIVTLHMHLLLAHLGAYKTLGLLRDYVWWKTMARDVQTYCDTCQTCKRSKPSNQKPYGLLNPLPVPSRPWEAVGIDFVGPLPESKNQDGVHDSITTVIDLLTGMVHLIPSRTHYSAKEVAELVFEHIYKHHGLPKAIVSDRDSLFSSLFWTHLHKLLNIELRISSAYHPESDGSTERANRTIGQMLRQCISPNQRDWVSKLPAIEFAINSAQSDTTGYAPFFLNSGQMPRSMIWDDTAKDEYPGVQSYAERVKNAVMSAHDSIIAARTKQTHDANRRRRPTPFVSGDLVYLSTKNISLPRGYSHKLAPKYIGPYKILRDYGNNSYKLDLPADLRSRGIHDVFHASLLHVHEPNDDHLFPGRLVSQVLDLGSTDGEWAIDKILTHQGRGEEALFEALWRWGDRTWIPYSTIANLDILKEYLEVLDISTIHNLAGGQLERLGPFASSPACSLSLSPFFRLITLLLILTSTATALIICQLPSSTIMSVTIGDHPYLRQLEGSPDFLLQDDEANCVYRFAAAQVWLFCRIDRQIRDGTFDYSRVAFPGGYDTFTDVWNRATDFPYRFSTIEVGSSLVVNGQHPPADQLAPLPAAPVVTPRFTTSQEDAIQGLLVEL
ncbi:hypothetical protein NUW54_g5037 [Trametes sanguinea]|uniref:Uncharacterized protein n=1 Tax=Trametes sanguinea TaxID=158606 RepID=A0ACC1PW91_9APHY|nr:hypothetical protein NUW54_g5037 [Trametes sanguinea]